jgi:hypothetical protein
VEKIERKWVIYKPSREYIIKRVVLIYFEKNTPNNNNYILKKIIIFDF